MNLNEFKTKHVQGLYSYAHYEAPNGAWIQVHLGNLSVVYCPAPGAKFQHFANLAALKAEFAA